MVGPDPSQGLDPQFSPSHPIDARAHVRLNARRVNTVLTQTDFPKRTAEEPRHRLSSVLLK